MAIFGTRSRQPVKRGSLPDRSKEHLSSLNNLGVTQTPLNGAPVTPIPGIKWRSVKITPDPPKAPRFEDACSTDIGYSRGNIKKISA